MKPRTTIEQIPAIWRKEARTWWRGLDTKQVKHFIEVCRLTDELKRVNYWLNAVKREVK